MIKALIRVQFCLLLAGLSWGQNDPITESDYLIVTHACMDTSIWYPQLETLLQNRGFEPGILMINDQTTAQEIQSFLFDANEVGVSLKYVLLVGAGSNINPTGDQEMLPKTEIRGLQQETANCENGNIIPFQYITMPIWNNEIADIATDDPYIQLINDEPQYVIGRVPVTTPIQMADWTEKLIHYYSQMNIYSQLTNELTFVGMNVDNPWNNLQGAVVDNIFDMITDIIPDSIQISTLFAAEIDPVNAWSNEVAPLVPSFVESVNEGAKLIHFLGTGSNAFSLGYFFRDVPADYYNHDMWQNACNYDLFTNSDQLPFMMGVSCELGRVQYPGQYQCVLQNLMNLANSGIIGFWAPTVVTSQWGCQIISQLFYQQSFNGSFPSLGEATLNAKVAFAEILPSKIWHSIGFVYYGDPSMPLPINQYVVDNLAENTNWKGTIVINSNINVPSGVVLTIDPGTTVFFKEGAGITVNGTLRTEGTENFPVLFSSAGGNEVPGVWQGLSADDAIEINMNHSIIENATNGLTANTSALFLDNVTIRSSAGSAIAATNGTTGWIRNTNLHDNNKGLSITNVGDDFEVRDNAIHHNQTGLFTHTSQADLIGNHVYENSQTGMLLTAGTNGFIANNEIDHNGNGVDYNSSGMYLVSSSPVLSKTLLRGTLPQENNLIHDNYGYGIYSSFTGLPNLGTFQESPLKISGGFNHFYNNSNTALYRNDNFSAHPGEQAEIPADYPSLMAEVNYWFPSLNNDTAPGAAEYHGAVQWYPVAATFNNGGTSDDYEHVALLGDGLIAEQDAEYEVAIDFYQQFLDSDPPNKDQMIAAMSGMDRCYGHLKAVDQWQVQLEAIAANFDKEEQQKLAQNYLIWVYKKLGLDAEAIAAAQSLIDDCSDPEYVDYYTLEIALLLYETEGSILAKTSPEQRQVADRIQQAQHHLLTTDNQTEAAQLYKLLTGGSGRVASGTVVPEAYALHSAYPNPFNPVTTIRYDLPEAGRVRVAVYDIRGRLVTTLTNEDKQPGSYHLQWQGKDASGRMVGSGLYFYTLEVLATEGKQTFRASRKMLLMK